MEVKDITSGTLSDASRLQAGNVPVEKKSEDNSSDSAAAVDTQSSHTRDTLQNANKVISAVNVAASATGEISKLVKSISGIVDQASKGDVPAKHLAVLQSEANQLVGAIKSKASDASSGDVKPLAGDHIQLDASQIGKKIDVALPNSAVNAFGLDKLNFSDANGLEQARSSVSNAQKQLASLKQAVDDSKSAVQSTVAHLDVALQNSEASRVSVRDLDDALKLANTAKSSISSDASSALASYGSLDSRLLNLLD